MSLANQNHNTFWTKFEKCTQCHLNPSQNAKCLKSDKLFVHPHVHPTVASLVKPDSESSLQSTERLLLKHGNSARDNCRAIFELLSEAARVSSSLSPSLVGELKQSATTIGAGRFRNPNWRFQHVPYLVRKTRFPKRPGKRHDPRAMAVQCKATDGANNKRLQTM